MKRHISNAVKYIRSYYNYEFSLRELASVANLSSYHFIRVFKNETGKTPFEYVMEVRIEKAKEMLELEQLKIIEVALRCGYDNPSHFSTTFKKQVGISPSRYRKTMNA